MPRKPLPGQDNAPTAVQGGRCGPGALLMKQHGPPRLDALEGVAPARTTPLRPLQAGGVALALFMKHCSPGSDDPLGMLDNPEDAGTGVGAPGSPGRAPRPT
jgi:hypothetical protein